jgi:hypothetical protein
MSGVHSTYQIPSDSDPNQIYQVTFGFQPDNLYCQYDWSCTCKAYQYNKSKYCKHIERAVAQACLWDSLVDGGGQVDKSEDTPKCPRCGGGIEYYQAAV